MLSISQPPKGFKVQIRCSGKKCPFKRVSPKLKAKKGSANVLPALKKSQRHFRAGQTIEVWVSAPGFNTKVARFLLKKGKIPTSQPFCVPPDASRPQRKCD